MGSGTSAATIVPWRVAEDGSPLAIPIAFPRTEQTGHEYGIVFGGGKYAIAAIEQHLIGIGQGSQPRLLRFLVDPKAGVVTQLPSVDTGGFEASVLWSGSRLIAYWMDYTATSFKLMTLPYDASTPAVVLSGTHIGHQPRLAFNGRNVFGAWNETIGSAERILAARFDSSVAALADAAPLLVSTGWSRQLVPSVATSGHDSLMVWVDERGEENQGHLLAARVALNGAVIDRTPIEISPVAYRWASPALVFTGATYLVVWQEPLPLPTIVARTVGRDGSLGARVSLGTGGVSSAVATTSATVVVRNDSKGASFYRFSPAGELLDTVPIAVNDTFVGSVATNGTDFFTVWSVGSDYWQFPSPDLRDVVGRRIAASGAADASPLPIATGPSNQIPKAVASDGRDYLVLYDVINYATWPTSRALAAKRVLREGQLEGATATDTGTVIASGTAPNLVAVAADTNGFWVAWLEETSVATLKLVHTDIHGNPGETAILDTFDRDTEPTWISLAQPPNAPLQIAYARRVTNGPFPQTSRVFVRLFGEIPEVRSRPVRH